MPPDSSSAVGFTVKSGWTAAVLVAGTPAVPRVVESCRVELSDPANPAARQPYHDGFGTAREAGAALSALVGSVKAFGHKSVAGWLARHQRERRHLAGAGIVVGSLIDPDVIGNSHIRIHALEGRLFRGVVTDAALARGLECATWCERDLYACAAANLTRSETHIRETLSELGRDIDGSWRAEQKAAALAAWLMLSGGVHAPRFVKPAAVPKRRARH